MKLPRRGLYAITQPEGKTAEQVIAEVEAALKGGAVLVQYRDKQAVDGEGLAGRLLRLCRSYHVPLIINDSVELALAVGADGVHLGRDDGNIAAARVKLGADAIIGVSCYNDIARATAAVAAGADYVAFGRFFPSGSKPLAAPAEIGTLREAKRSLPVPIVAIGGILPENAGQLLAAGADLLAVIGGVFDGDPFEAARRFRALF
ncbi:MULTISPECIES: thiamine phosphate synthase [Methylomonas]|uniref:Thiamine-phosphate synthase n=1 Tax=Methylomonas koyamae TaxID=702114 RepID=A0A291IKM0_9GAMM|nr:MULTISPECIES: thiamine phosphate synthase [Methylomonas]ANE55879.1 thiamine-phosphate diphosphorylase [Methylomonas sp. DH-1]ATG90748.1 thiamine-phosphate pyrophosphorylase [Methylomonas koyamae]OAI22188.1 thiamine phosphate synthase [Methylomonas koyamae]